MSIGEHEIIPKMFQLYPAYPNPFNPVTTIRFLVETRLIASLHIYDIAGRLVKTLAEGEMNPGEHEITWDASDLSSGVYFIVLKSAQYSQNQKAILLK
jgi:flagellar hook assembly protein FlgD